MRHRVYGRHLGRNKDERTSLFKNLVRSLIISEKIETTQAKAKAIKGLVDKLITQAKSPTTARLVNQFLIEKKLQEKLILEILPRLQDRSSGYTTIVKLGRRSGDGSSIVRMSFMEDKGKESRVKVQESIEETESKKEVKSKVEKIVIPSTVEGSQDSKKSESKEKAKKAKKGKTSI